MKIKDANNFTTGYGFSCGYQERRESDNISLELYKEHSVYHVRFNRFDLPYAKRKDCKGWESFDKLSEAKKRFFELCKVFNFKKYK